MKEKPKTSLEDFLMNRKAPLKSIDYAIIQTRQFQPKPVTDTTLSPEPPKVRLNEGRPLSN